MSNDLHTLSGAYALDALSAEEATEFRSHLAGCPACRDEVTELRDAAARMGASEALQPPTGLRARVLEAASRQPQLPPKVPVRAGTRRWLPRVVAAAAAVVVVIAGAIVVRQLQGGTEAPMSPAVSQVFTASDAHRATVETANGGRLTVATSHRLNRMAVETDKLPRLGREQFYQIWAVHGAAMTSAAVLADVKAGAAMAMPGPGTKVAITIEPAGGSRQPTTKPIVMVDPARV